MAEQSPEILFPKKRDQYRSQRFGRHVVGLAFEDAALTINYGLRYDKADTVVERMMWAWFLTLPVTGTLSYLAVMFSRCFGWIR